MEGLHIINSMDNTNLTKGFEQITRGFDAMRVQGTVTGRDMDVIMKELTSSFDGYAKAATRAGLEVNESLSTPMRRLQQLQQFINANEKDMASLRQQIAQAPKGSTLQTTLIEQYGRLNKVTKDYKAEFVQLSTQTRKGFKQMEDDINGVTGATNKLKGATNEIGGIFGKAAGMAAGFFSLRAAKDFALQVFNVRSQMQQLEVSFSTLLGSKEKSDKLIAEAVDFAAKTPFNLSGVMEGAKQMIAYGSSAEDVVKEMRMLGDVAAGLNIPLNSLVYLYGTLRSSGRVTTIDMRQFANRGIPIWKELEKVTGENTVTLQQWVSQGKVSFAMIEQAFKNMTSEGGQFFNLMENQSKTLRGRWSNIQDTVEQAFNEIGKKTEGVFNTSLDVIAKLVENYEVLGKVVAGAAIAFGTNKAALMVLDIAMKAGTASTFADTIAQNANTAAKGLNTRETLRQIAATDGAAAAQRALNLALLKNPWVIIGAAVVAATAAIVAYARSTDAAVQAKKELDKATKDYNESMRTEQAEIDFLFGKLKGAKEGTDEWKAARKAIMDKYGDYLKDLGDEKTALDDVEKAYRRVKAAALEAASARAMDSYTAAAGDKLVKQLGSAKEDLEKALKAQFDPAKAGELYSQLEAYIGTAYEDLPQEVRKVVDTITSEGRNPYTGESTTISKGKNIFNTAAGYQAAYDSTYDTAVKRFGTASQKLMQVESDLTKKEEERANAQKRLVDGLGDDYGKILAEAQAYYGGLEKTDKEYENYLANHSDDSIVQSYYRTKYIDPLDSTIATLTRQKEELQKRVQENPQPDGSGNGSGDGGGNGGDGKGNTHPVGSLADLKERLSQAQKAVSDAINEQEYVAAQRLVESLQKQIDELQNRFQGAFLRQEITKQNEQEYLDQLAKIRRDAVRDAKNDPNSIYNQLAGNVDLINRKVIKADALNAKGWDAGDGIATFFSSQYGVMDKEGEEHQILITPILPDGTVLSQRELEDYIDNVLQGAEDILKADRMKIVIGVDVSEDGLSGELLHQADELATSGEAVDALTEKYKDLGASIGGLPLEKLDTSVLFPDATAKAMVDWGEYALELETFTSGQLKDAITSTRAELDNAVKSGKVGEKEAGVLREKLNLLWAALSKVTEEEKNEQDEGEKSLTTWKDQMEVINEAAAALQSLGDTIGGTVGQMVGFVGSLATSFVAVTDGLHLLKTGADEAGKSLTAMETASIVLAVISAAVKVLKAVIGIVKENKAANDAATRSAQEYAQALGEVNAEYKKMKLSNAFGEDEANIFRQNTAAAKEYLKNINALSSQLNGITSDNRSWWQKLWGTKKENIVTLSATDYTNPDGSFNGDKLRTWYEQYGDTLEEEQKLLIDGMLSDWDNYVSGVEDSTSYLSSIFNDVAQTVSETMVDNFLETGDALSDMSDLADDFARSMAVAAVKSMLMEKVFTQDAQDAIAEMLSGGNVEGAIENYNNLLEEANAMSGDINAFLQGIDLSSTATDDRSAQTRNSLGASQESVDESNARLTTIQQHTYYINENVSVIRSIQQAIAANTASILEQVMGIHSLTGNMFDRLGEVQTATANIKSNVGTMIDRGVKIQ